MKRICIIIIISILAFANLFAEEGEKKVIKLPKPVKKGTVSVEEAIQNRRSRRSYAEGAISLQDVSQILWSAQGITSPRGFRAAPSAGATYPLETYLVAGNVEGVLPGLYNYNPSQHSLELVKKGDLRKELASAAWGQEMIAEAPASVVFTAIYERTTGRYGDRGIRYVHMDVGHAGENIHLQAESLGLGTVVIGAFSDSDVAAVIGKKGEHPLYIMPIGKKK